MSRPNQFLSPEGDLEDYFVDEYWLIDQWVGDTLWSWGRNAYGSIGDNTSGSNRCTPVTTLAGGTNWKQISSGNEFVSGIKTDGTLWTWGRNSYGQLGINNTTNRSTPVTTFAGGTNWKQVDLGNSTAVAIKTDGTLWTWGNNYSGQLGINVGGASNNRLTPVTTFAGGTNWKQSSCGSENIAAIKTDGTLWAWGRQAYPNLGINAPGNRSTPVTTFAGGTNWKQVSSGQWHTAAIKTDGTLWIWGGNAYPSLGINAPISRSTPVTTFAGGTNWKQVATSTHTTYAIKTDSTLWVWGGNYQGKLGTNMVGGTTNRSTPVTTFAGGTNWKQVASGFSFAAAIKTDGTLWTWGYGSDGQLGNNRLVSNIRTPVTTFAGGTNWKQVASGFTSQMLAITSGTDPTFFIS